MIGTLFQATNLDTNILVYPPHLFSRVMFIRVVQTITYILLFYDDRALRDPINQTFKTCDIAFITKPYPNKKISDCVKIHFID